MVFRRIFHREEPKNLDLTEFLEKNQKKLSRLLTVKLDNHKEPIPVFNRGCLLCQNGWNQMSINKLAIANNFLYHASCLQKKDPRKYNHKNTYIGLLG